VGGEFSGLNQVSPQERAMPASHDSQPCTRPRTTITETKTSGA